VETDSQMGVHCKIAKLHKPSYAKGMHICVEYLDLDDIAKAWCLVYYNNAIGKLVSLLMLKYIHIPWIFLKYTPHTHT
jgi:hypothetical protein